MVKNAKWQIKNAKEAVIIMDLYKLTTLCLSVIYKLKLNKNLF